MAFLAPSVTPWYPAPVPGGTAINPSLRRYSYNASAILDYDQYHVDLAALAASVDVGGRPKEQDGGPWSTDVKPVDRQANNSNASNSNGSDIISSDQAMSYSGPVWDHFYKATEFYNVKSLDVLSMSQAFDRLFIDNSFFMQYYLVNSAGYENGLCDDRCKQSQLCAIKNVKVPQLERCMKGVAEGVSGLFPPDGSVPALSIAVNMGIAFVSVSAVVFLLVLVLLNEEQKQVLRQKLRLLKGNDGYEQV